MVDAQTVIHFLVKSRDEIKKQLSNTICKDNHYHYETFGKEIEPILTDIISSLLLSNKIINDPQIIQPSSNKNEFPDLKIASTPVLAIEFKSGNHWKKKGANWIKCNNSNNDMGTLNQWDSKLKKFGGDNIYYVFVEYSFNDMERKIIDVKIEPFYKFLELNSDNVLRYRKKDGNLRPKNFDKSSKINTLEQFNELLVHTKIHRSKSIIKEHVSYLPPKEVNAFLESLKNSES